MDSFNNNDPFKQFVKGKLADYKHEVTPSSWEELESSLFATQKIKATYTKWIVSSVAAIAAALIGVFFLFHDVNNKLSIQIAEYQTKQQQTTSTHKEDKLLITKKKSTKIEKSTPPLLTDNSSLLQQKTSTPYVIREREEKEKTTIDISDKASHAKNDDIATPKKQKTTQEKDKTLNIDEETKQKMIQDFINEGKYSSNKIKESRTSKKKSKFALSLSGRSSLSASQQINSVPTTLRSSVSESYGMYMLNKMKTHKAEESDVNPKSEKTHRQPISFGILTSFNISHRLQIETGIIYTYLSSETKNNSGDFHNGEKTQFHYLGIPISVNYTILSINKLDVFLSSGGMIEKDIYGKIKNDKKESISLNSGYPIESSSKINQKHPQLSVSGGMGFTYPLYNRAKLFGKIGGRYYINANNEYKTYYSDEKLGLDIQLGVKFNF